MKHKLIFFALTLCLAGFAKSNDVLDDAASSLIPSSSPEEAMDTMNALATTFQLDVATPSDWNMEMPAACSDVKLTKDQESKLISSFLDFAKTATQLAADAKIAGIDYVKSLIGSDRGATMKTQTTVEAKIPPLVTSVLTFVSSSFQDILTPEQRLPALKCLVALKMEHSHRHCRK